MLAYGMGLLKHGYWNSPMEIMARKYTDNFLNNSPALDVVPLIHHEEEHQIIPEIN